LLLVSPVAGKVARVNVNAGDAVGSGQVLVEFE
jgi:biotin carboxyl carrier protein